MKKVPSPLQIVCFFGMAVIFATWQPVVWWRIMGGAISLASGFYGLYLLWRQKQQDTSGKP